MILQLQRILIFFSLIYTYLLSPLHSEESENTISIIERSNFQKKISVEKLTHFKTGKLKNYHTFSLNFSGEIIFCHISIDGSEPRVICH